jgi:hypothetical protein
VGVVLLSSLFFRLAGVENWKLLACIWAAIPVFNCLLFLRAPLAPLVPEGERGMSVKELFSNRLFWILFVMMFCALTMQTVIRRPSLSLIGFLPPPGVGAPRVRKYGYILRHECPPSSLLR